HDEMVRTDGSARAGWNRRLIVAEPGEGRDERRRRRRLRRCKKRGYQCCNGGEPHQSSPSLLLTLPRSDRDDAFEFVEEMKIHDQLVQPLGVSVVSNRRDGQTVAVRMDVERTRAQPPSDARV